MTIYQQALTGIGAYSASKAAVVSFCEILAAECRQNGIRVVCVCPEAVETPMLQTLRHIHPETINDKPGIPPTRFWPPQNQPCGGAAYILALLKNGRQMSATVAAQIRVVSRALQKRAPFHLNKNSVADALLIELYAEVISVQQGDRREPHADLAGLFDGSTSRYFYRIKGLRDALAGYLGDEFEQMLEESDFQENPRTLTEVLEAEQEFFERVWFERSVRYTDRWESGHRGGRFDTEEGLSCLHRGPATIQDVTARPTTRAGRLRAGHVEREVVDAALGVG